MSKDRSVHTDALQSLGNLIGPEEKRDAIHLAVEPVIAGHELKPGESIVLSNGRAVCAHRGEATGIVDPFLSRRVQGGERFWMILLPRTITSLRHVWSHPAFPEEGMVEVTEATIKIDAENWLRKFASDAGLSFLALLRGAEAHIISGDDICFGHDLDYSEDWDEFWIQYELYTGKSVGRENRGSFFRCAC
jgi:hypothetical protein